MKRIKTLISIAVVLFVGAQFVRFKHTNPPVTGVVNAPPAVKKVLMNSCFHCHSNVNNWPWFSQVAPASWLVYSDVTGARSHVNFTTWNLYQKDPLTLACKLKLIKHEVETGDMPPFYFLAVHPQDSLTAKDRKLIANWVDTGLAHIRSQFKPNGKPAA